MFVSCFNFFYSYFVYLLLFSIFMHLFIYLVSISFQKKSSFSNMFYNKNNLIFLKKILFD
jgi:hypothetical protein